jgi:3-phenylpropionate/trans-cinnamate dioxygenase ferredoxin subunit
MSESELPNSATLPLEDLPVGKVKQVIINNEPVAVCNVDGEIHAIHDHCTHVGIELSGGFLDGHELICPWHGAAFDVRTGVPQSGPASIPCRRYTVAVEEQTITVTDQIPPAPKP